MLRRYSNPVMASPVDPCSNRSVPGLSNSDLSDATRRLITAGCVAADEEVAELAAVSHADGGVLAVLVDRRTRGEPLAWITGTARFCGCTIVVDPGVYVPRWQSEPLAERAADLLAPDGRAIDLGTGSGAIARVLLERRPAASVLGTECDPASARCARRNGVAVAEGDLFEGVPPAWTGTVDVVVGVLPYVPTDQLEYLPRDVRDFEPRGALDGGTDGLDVVRRAVIGARPWLRDGGHLLLEIGGEQPRAIVAVLERARFAGVRIVADADGDPRRVEAVATSGPR